MGKSFFYDYKILFAKKSKANNSFLFGFYSFLFFSLLFNVLLYLVIFKEKNISNAFLFAEMYPIVALIFLCRIMESRENTEFSYTLPISKRIYTNDLCFLFCVFSFCMIALKVIGTVICMKKGCNFEYFRGIIFGDIIIQFVNLLITPVFLKITAKEYAGINFIMRNTKVSISVILIYVFVLLPLILIIIQFLEYVDLFVKNISLPIFVLICLVMFIMGIVINCVLLHRNYNKR